MKCINRIALFAIFSVICYGVSVAAEPLDTVPALSAVPVDSVVVFEEITVQAVAVKEEPTVEPVAERSRLGFAWGADIGAAIDLTGNDMSAFEFNVLLGIRRGGLNLLGVGIGADISITNSMRAYPMFVALRTNFRDKPSLLFWDARAGVAYNQLEHNHQQWGVYINTGVGVNLASSSRFSSTLSLNYEFRQRRKVVGAEMTHDFTDLHLVCVRLGVLF